MPAPPRVSARANFLGASAPHLASKSFSAGVSSFAMACCESTRPSSGAGFASSRLIAFTASAGRVSKEADISRQASVLTFCCTWLATSSAACVPSPPPARCSASTRRRC